MPGLFEGVPTQSPTGATTSTETPKWFQDLVYQQMMAAKGVADLPYSAYGLPRVAGLSPDQEAAYSSVRGNVGAWSPSMGIAVEGGAGLTGPTDGFGRSMTMMDEASSAIAPDNIDRYMNPYTKNVTDEIARLGSRNLQENILPGVSDSFIRAGQFGSSRMGDIGSRAIRDTQTEVLGQQAGALERGYSGALTAAQADLDRKLRGGYNIGTLAGSEATRQQGALGFMADLGQQQQGLMAQDAAALETVGTVQQQQRQREMDMAYQSWLEQQQYPQRQLDWYQAQLKGAGQYVPTTTTSSGYTTEFSPSPLSQLASGYFALRGLGEK